MTRTMLTLCPTMTYCDVRPKSVGFCFLKIRSSSERREPFWSEAAHQLQVTIGICVRSDLAVHLESDDMTNQLLFLPV